MSAPEISCVIPAYENLALFEACLASALAQTGVRLEVIVSDDSKSADVRTLVERLIPAHPQLRYLAGARNGNPVDNWNCGLDAATGRHIVLLHHDEIFADPHHLRRALDALAAAPAPAFHVSGVQVRTGARSSRFALVSTLARRLRAPGWSLMLINWLGPTGAVVFPDIGLRFDPRLVWRVDTDFYLSLFEHGLIMVRTDGSGVISTLHDQQITAVSNPRRLNVAELARQRAERPDRLKPWQWRLALTFARLRAGR